MHIISAFKGSIESNRAIADGRSHFSTFVDCLSACVFVKAHKGTIESSSVLSAQAHLSVKNTRNKIKDGSQVLPRLPCRKQELQRHQLALDLVPLRQEGEQPPAVVAGKLGRHLCVFRRE